MPDPPGSAPARRGPRCPAASTSVAAQARTNASVGLGRVSRDYEGFFNVLRFAQEPSRARTGQKRVYAPHHNSRSFFGVRIIAVQYGLFRNLHDLANQTSVESSAMNFRSQATSTLTKQRRIQRDHTLIFSCVSRTVHP